MKPDDVCLILIKKSLITLKERLLDMAKKSRETVLYENHFIPLSHENRFGTLGKHFAVNPDLGAGIYWLYEPNSFFNIKIHDFFYNDDIILDMKLPESLAISYYESVSGEELSPYRRLSSNMVRTHINEEKPFRALIHKKIPIRSISIEITPDYYDNYLRTNYPDEFHNLKETYTSFNETSHFPEMVSLLTHIKNYRGEGASARFFYEAKVTEAVSLLVEFRKTKQRKTKPKVSIADRETVHTVSMYIRDHYTDDLNLDILTRIASVCGTKLKNIFREVNGCTITEYIQSTRIGQAQHLLQYTDLSVNQVSCAIGYRSASRFTELFKRYTGLMPKEYRKLV